MKNPTKPSDIQKKIARHTANVFGIEKPSIIRFVDDNGASEVNILVGSGTPEKGTSSYATIGLSDHPLIFNGNEFDARVELLGVCGSDVSNFNNVLATLAFCVINSKWFCAPGIIFPDVISMHDASKTMTDIYFSYPFLWGDKFNSLKFDGRNVAWLLAVPVSKAETEYAARYGSSELEKLLSEKHIDISDLNRESIV